MKQLMIVLSVLIITFVNAQDSYKTLFRVKDDPGTKMKSIRYGKNIGLKETSGCIIYINSSDYPDEENYVAGLADISKVSDSYSLVHLQFRKDFTYKEGSTLLVEVPCPLPNPGYIGLCYKVAALGVNFFDSFDEVITGFQII